ncbi:hypothetical protein PENSPDRAFT_757874 [Peniophora sp. CONT]|nr:hypothetical protein PENSPDRAFT_757874 [Peniophora sp. CONT]
MPIAGRRSRYCLTVPRRAERALRGVASSALIRLGGAIAPSTSNHPHSAQSFPAPTSNPPQQTLPEAEAETSTLIMQPSSVPPAAHDSLPPPSPTRPVALVDSLGQPLEDANTPPRMYARRTVPLPDPSPPQAAEHVEDGEQDNVLQEVSSVAPRRAGNAVPMPDYVHVQHLRATAATLGVSIPANSTGWSAVTMFGGAYSRLQDRYASFQGIVSRAQRRLEALRRAHPDSPTVQQEIGRIIDDLKRLNPAEHAHTNPQENIVPQYGQV